MHFPAKKKYFIFDVKASACEYVVRYQDMLDRKGGVVVWVYLSDPVSDILYDHCCRDCYQYLFTGHAVNPVHCQHRTQYIALANS